MIDIRQKKRKKITKGEGGQNIQRQNKDKKTHTQHQQEK